ncbi:hypothetical protein TRVL_07122 [Trypanosoma vivax]|nr:hypothetical protein TRVL_07122 [Trypanosoma vivax]
MAVFPSRLLSMTGYVCMQKSIIYGGACSVAPSFSVSSVPRKVVAVLIFIFIFLHMGLKPRVAAHHAHVFWCAGIQAIASCLPCALASFPAALHCAVPLI